MKVYKVGYEYSFGDDIFSIEAVYRFLVCRDLAEATRRAHTGVRARLRSDMGSLWDVKVTEIPFAVVED